MLPIQYTYLIFMEYNTRITNWKSDTLESVQWLYIRSIR